MNNIHTFFPLFLLVGNVLGNTSLSNLATSLKKDHTALYKPSVRHVPETNKYSEYFLPIESDDGSRSHIDRKALY